MIKLKIESFAPGSKVGAVDYCNVGDGLLGHGSIISDQGVVINYSVESKSSAPHIHCVHCVHLEQETLNCKLSECVNQKATCPKCGMGLIRFNNGPPKCVDSQCGLKAEGK